VKLIKNNGKHEAFVLSDIQCYNEVFIYNKVLRYYDEELRPFKSEFGPEIWSPKVYLADYLKSKGLKISGFDKVLANEKKSFRVG
jgi:hypothetical protein